MKLTTQELTVLADMMDHIAAAHFANDIHRAEYLACEAAARVVRAVAEEMLMVAEEQKP